LTDILGFCAGYVNEHEHVLLMFLVENSIIYVKTQLKSELDSQFLLGMDFRNRQIEFSSTIHTRQGSTKGFDIKMYVKLF
jgi:hypothetical protein